ncbi:MAG: type IV pili methyl-accepting chemotaxis transducer N-terminal domain-containing protein [Pseudomonadota bacterium]
MIGSAVLVQAAENAPDLKRKINIAGKQRMLSQRMAQAACFQAVGVKRKKQAAIMAQAQDAFANGLKALRYGSVELRINAIRDLDALAELDVVDGLWPAYFAALADGADDVAGLDEVSAQSGPILTAANAVVVALEATNTDASVGAELVRLVNVAGRQRMLTQRAAKEFCLIAAGVNVDDNRKALSDTLALFERSLNGLMYGDADMGLVEAPTDDILMQLAFTADLWNTVRAPFQKAVDIGRAGSIERLTVVVNIDAVLKAADEAVWMYENI